MTRRVLAFFLAMVMVLGMVPMQIFATETETVTEPVVVEETEAVESTEATPVESEVVATTTESAPNEEAPTVPAEETEEAPTEDTTEAPAEEGLDDPADGEAVVIDLQEEDVEPADPAVVYVTGAIRGVLAKAKDGSPMVNKAVTVTDLNSDGVLTFDEALTAAHAAYCPDGYATEEEQFGTAVIKLWGEEDGHNYYFFKNKVALAMNVGDTGSSYVEAGDKLYATVIADPTDCSDIFTWFDGETKEVEAGQEFTLNLKGFEGMSYAPVTEAIAGVKVGTWESGKFTALAGKTTDAEGNVTLSFDKAGTYYVTAKGTVEHTASYTGNDVDAPIMPPVCVVTVTGEPEPEFYVESLNIYTTQDSYKAGNGPIAVTPEFDGSVYTGYSATVADYLDYIYMVGKVSPAPQGADLTAFISNNWSGWNGNKVSADGSFANNAYFKKGYAGVYLKPAGREKEYQITINQYATLSGLTIDGVMDKDFNRDVTAYHAYVDGSAEGVAIKATGYKSTYTLTINGEPLTSGTEYTLPYSWDESGKMLVTIQVSGTNRAESTYTIELEKQPVVNKPFVLRESGEADYTVIDKDSYVKDLFVIASASGEMTYQWFSNTTASTEGGTAIAEATKSTFTPPITEVGTLYYYCQITNTGAESDNVAYSTPTRVTVDPDPTPVATLVNPGSALEGYNWSKGYVYAAGTTEVTPLEVNATSAVDGMLSYQWYYSTTQPYGLQSYNLSRVNNATSASFVPPTDLSSTNNDGRYYVCQVTNTFKGRTYTAYTTTGETYEDYDVMGAFVFLSVTEASVPEITKQPVGGTYMVDDYLDSLQVSATRKDGGGLSYQWYVNTVNSTEGATPVESRYGSYLNLGKATEPGTKYYFCVVTNTIQGYTAMATSDIVAITINSLEGLVGDKLTGEGTEESPYLINTAEDYVAVAELVAQTVSFKDMYLKQTQDIELPADWAGIGCLIDPSVGHINAGKNLAAFSGTLDGGGNTIIIPEGGLPLLGYVRGATVKNLNISGKKIAGYGLVNHLEGVSLNGNAITIDNVTLKSGSSTQKAGFIGTYITNNGFAGCSAGFTVTIKNSKIEENVIIGYDADQAMIGSFAGRVHGTIENCVSYATVKGTSYVGGIIGTLDNAMGSCVVNNCQFYGTVEASGEHAGGILGGGYENSTAPNGWIPSITNCTVEATVTGADKVGGIMGGDSFVAQSWGGWSLTGNSFNGTVKATSGTNVGGVVGYLLSMNKCTGISDNTYNADCGADRGIAYVKYLDTSAENPKTFEGTVAFDTSKGTDACPTVAGCGWKENFNRTDDPLGKDASKLCKKIGGPAAVPTLELMVNNSWRADRNDPQKAVLGEDNIFRVANRTAAVGKIWGSVEEGSTVEFSILRGKSGSFSSYQNNCTSDNVYDGTTYQFYYSNSVKLPLVAKFNVTGAEGGKATYYLVVDQGEIGTYTIGGAFTSESELFNAETGIAFNEAGQTLNLTIDPVNLGSGQDTTAKWTYTTSDNHVALVDSNGKVTCVGGGTATITATCDMVTVTTTVTAVTDEHTTHTYGDNNKCTICGDRKPNDVSVQFTLLDNTGAYVTASDESNTQLYRAALTVSDLDCDGTITYVDLFTAAHALYCADGADGFTTASTELGLYITQFWGEETSAVGYYANNKVVYNMTDRVSGNTNLVAFFYQDAETYYDLYTWFAKDSCKTVTGYDKVFTVNGDNDQAPKGATVTVLDETGAAVEELTTTVDENGQFTINFSETGNYTVWVKGICSYNYWGTDVTDAPVVPSFQTVEVMEPKSAVLNITIVDDQNNFVKTTDGEEVYRYAFEAVDDPENPDGKVTIIEALKQIHAQKCPAGAAGLTGADQGFIQYVWGVNTYGWLSYYYNDVWMQGYGATLTGTYDREFVDRLLGTEINPNGQDDYCLYMFQTYGDTYTYFYPREETAVSGVAKEFTLLADKSRRPQTPVGASVTVTDSEGRVLEELSTTTDENGKFTIVFPTAGQYTIDVGNAARQAYTHSRCFVTVSGVEADKRVLLGGESTKLQIRTGDKVNKNVTWTLSEDDEAYITMTVKNGVATVKAKDVSEKHVVTIGAATADSTLSATLTILPKAQGIVLSQEDVTVDLGADFDLPVFTATVLPADAGQSVTWKSSNEKVATVEDGVVSLTGYLGTAKITATTTDGTKLSATATITVVDLAQSIVLTGEDTILGGKSATYTAAEEDGTAIKASEITWTLSDTTYASVNASGKVTTKAVPETVELTLTATIEGSDRSATKTITLTPAATYVDILIGDSLATGAAFTCNVSDESTSLPLSAKVYPQGSAQAVTWKSSNEKVATVAEGIVTFAGKTGTATITATTTDGTGKKATVKVTFDALTTKVEIEEHAETLRSGEKLSLKATTDLAKVGVTWALADPADKAYVTLSANGTVKAKTVYETHVVTLCAFAKDGWAMAETTLTILPKNDQVLVLTHADENVTKTTQSVNRSAGTYTLSAANVAGEAQNVTWKTSNKKVVSLSAAQGTDVTLNLLKSGTATITAIAEDGTKTTVTIKVTTLVESLTITGSDTVASGKSVTLKAVAAPSTAAKKSVTWTLADDGVAYASINASGKLTAAKNLMTAQTVTVVATAKDGSGVVAKKEITIQPIATSILVQQKAQTVDMQKTASLQLTGKVYPASANQGIQWTSSNAKVATVDETGLVTFHKGGTVTITAATTDGSNKKATVKLTVVKGVESLSLSDTFLASGKSVNLAKFVEVGPADASNKKLTWSLSGDTAFATLSASGTLKAKTVTEMKTVYVTVTAADGYGATTTATVHIYPATTEVLLEVDGETVTGTVKLPEGESLQLNAISLPLDAYQDWTWSSSNDSYAEVDETGCVTGLKAGKTVTITAKANDGTGKKATLRIQITEE